MDPERYHRSRPRYPAAFVRDLVDEIPGRDVLDVGVGTGIVAGQAWP
jgi:ubiquinone/menaquinone biosynthesis C-methylase UbiE